MIHTFNLIKNFIKKFYFSIIIAMRFSKLNKKNNTLLFLYIFSTFSISIGVASLIIGLSIMNGFKSEINNKILNFVPHGEIKKFNKPFNNWKFILKKIKKIKGIMYAEPYININALIEKNNKFKILFIKGLGINKNIKNNFLRKYISYNELINFFSKKNQIIISKNVSNYLSVKKGDWIKVILSNNNLKNNFLSLKTLYFQVIKILNYNLILDKNFAIIPLYNAQKLLNNKKNISGIFIKIKNIFNINNFFLKIKKKCNEQLIMKSWKYTFNYIYKDIKIIKIIIHLSMMLVILVSCFNIISIIIIVLKDKIYDIAILYTLGLNYRFTRFIFILYGIRIGINSSIIGSIIGIIFTLNLNFLIKKIEILLGYKILSEKIYFIDFIPSKIYCLDIIYVFFITIIFSFLASLNPSKKISSINPIKILKK
ncbi:FtsX-like permease family protein [Sodalis-like secondary symbiont of Drepanosiphum platanoidis]|uniref:FtsX-like permease family protein n=1 Tax=Sodalis-like secondary symbiont of Drepanosiphum platanoidis TaxID=2994493 RepID=UPI0034646C77